MKVRRFVYNLIPGSIWIVDALCILHFDICAGIDCVAEDCDVVPGLVDRGRERVDVDLELSPRRQDDHSECRVGGLTPQSESVGLERAGNEVLSASMSPYADFAFWWDTTTHGELERVSRPLAATGPEYPSAMETLRHLNSAMEQTTDAESTVNLIPMDLDVAFSKTIQRHPSPEEWETRCQSRSKSSFLHLLPFQLSTSSVPTMVPPSLSLSPTATVAAAHDLVSTNSDLRSLLDPPIRAMHGTRQISATGSGSGSGHTETASMLQEEMIAGPSLFQLLDDDGME